MRLGVVSDTHGHVERTRPAVRMLESLGVDRVLHCGDIGSAEVVALFAPWPTDFVFGNCDVNRQSLAAAIEAAGQTCHHAFGGLEIDGKRVALLHSDDRRQFQQAIDSGEWDLVCYGHTHIAAIERRGKTLVLNPGALYRANPHSLAVVELPSLEATIVAL
ncbi:MAG: YfcE family phosphodiesterase [Planctomycetota bacterium]|nr:MAG: YfcE family phosphodiesterase [Planctomycetota bacterium]